MDKSLRQKNIEYRKGSALILTIVLTVLLSIIGVTFLMVARLDEVVSASGQDEKTLNSAVENILGVISEELILDTPGVNDQEYYDYPGENDKWLASIEPHATDDVYTDGKSQSEIDEIKEKIFWSQISDVTGYLAKHDIETNRVFVRPGFYYGGSDVVKEYPDIDVDSSTGELLRKTDIHSEPDVVDLDDDNILYSGQLADADGDGIADSKWIELEDFSSPKGEKIYAAIRIVDNCGMVNVNTAMANDVKNLNMKLIDGSSLTHIDLAGLVGRKSGDNYINVLQADNDNNPNSTQYRLGDFFKGMKGGFDGKGALNINGRYSNSKIGAFYTGDEETSAYWNGINDAWFEDLDIDDIRNIDDYFAWRWGDNSNLSMSFGIDDELWLRERFCVQASSGCRLEKLWPWRDDDKKWALSYFKQEGSYDASGGSGLADWIDELVATKRVTEPEKAPIFEIADKKHWLTAYSFDRMINPDGRKQFCINIDPAQNYDRESGDRVEPLLDQRDSSGRRGSVEGYSQKTAKKLYYTLLKAACEDKQRTGRDELTEAELRKIAQLAVNIVDMRDKDTDVTCLNITVPQSGSFSTSEYGNEFEYLEPSVWYDSTDDIDPRIVLDDPNEVYVYGIEPQPVIAGVACGYEKDPRLDFDPTDPDYIPNNADYDPIAHYAIEIYNPFDFDIDLSRAAGYSLTLRNRARPNDSRTVRLDSTNKLVNLPAKSFLILCDDYTYWQSKINTARATNGVSSVMTGIWGGLELSDGMREMDRASGEYGTTYLDRRIRVPYEVQLWRSVRVSKSSSSTHTIMLDRYKVNPQITKWVDNTEVVRQSQRFTMGYEESNPTANFRIANNQWWDCLYPSSKIYVDGEVELAREHRGTETGDLLKPDVDFSMPFALYRDLKYYESPRDEIHENNLVTGVDREDEGKTGLHSDYRYRPTLDFATVGDVSRIWAFGPKRYRELRDIMETSDDYYQYYVGERIPDDVAFDLYDPNDLYVQYDPNDANTMMDIYTVGDMMNFVSNDKDRERHVRIDLRDPLFSNFFQYITAFDPSRDYIDNDGDGVEDPDYDVEFDDWAKNSGGNWDFAGSIDRSEWKIPGRINVNTAPWFVIAQLPWVKADQTDPRNAYSFTNQVQYSLAQEIVSYRDKLNSGEQAWLGSGVTDYTGDNGRFSNIKDEIMGEKDQDDVREEKGFASIGELALVVGGDIDYRIDKLGQTGNDVDGYPDLITDSNRDNERDDFTNAPKEGFYEILGSDFAGDGADDDFEEKDLIFSRLSNLATVRSDTFTAYILVRLGADGPQKRVIATLDRTDVYPIYKQNGQIDLVATNSTRAKTVGKVKVVGLKQVGDINY